ncbi:MAG TPA: thiamine pyrophosphate-binding protein [Vicinamibacterales bacterium]|jgi:acetolactate synthase-1/2/3 large subunit
MMLNTSEVIVQALERAGIRYVFGYPGGQNTRFIQAMHGSGVEFVLVTHEACAGFMADVTARLTGRPGACLSTLGPGATNMTTGVGNALLDRVPLLAFTGKMGRTWRGRTVQMQIDHQALYAPVTKWTAELDATSVEDTLRKAIAVAQAEQPGPVHLDFPEDVAEEESPGLGGGFPGAVVGIDGPLDATLKQAEDAIRGARRPLVAVGLTMNRAGATDALRAFVARHRLPVVSTLMAKGHIPDDDPHFVGVVGRARRDIVADFCRPADLVVGVGYDPVEFNYEDWVGRDVPVVHIDTVRADLAPTHQLACEAVGDIRQSLEYLARVAPFSHGWDLSALAAHRRRLFDALTPPSRGFTPHHVLLAVRERLASDGVLVADVGAHTHLIGQLWDTRGPGHFLVSNGWSSMGFSIPAAIAAKLVRPEQQVVACTGDGGYLMMLGEINTAVRLHLPIVFVVLRDRYLSLIRVKQTRRHFAWTGVQIYGDNYRASDTLFGAPVVVAENEEAFRAAFASALGSTGPTLIEAVVDPAEYDLVV